MMWATMAAVALILGFILYGTIQPEIPPELDPLKLRGGAASAVPVRPNRSQTIQTRQLGDWLWRQSGPAVEITRDFEGSIVVDGVVYLAPQIGVLCSNGNLQVRVDARSPVTGRTSTPVTVAGHEAQWDKTASTNILAQRPQEFLKALQKQGELELTFSFRDLGLATAKVRAGNLQEVLKELPKECRF